MIVYFMIILSILNFIKRNNIFGCVKPDLNSSEVCLLDKCIENEAWCCTLYNTRGMSIQVEVDYQLYLICNLKKEERTVPKI